MPKVTEDHFQEKRDQIIDAAFEICREKPAYDLTMSDIVSRTGMSQGGVYKYYNNIDKVLAALIDRANTKGNFTGQIDEVMGSKDGSGEKLRKLFDIAEQYFSDMLISYNKILFELSSFFVYSPEKRDSIYKNVTTSSTFEHLTGCAAQTIFSGIKNGEFKPAIPPEDIMAYLVASFDGIIRDVTITKCYSSGVSPETKLIFDEKRLIRCLYISTMNLLGIPVSS